LVKATGNANTSQLSRDHTISVAKSGLVTIAGGKWTTCRHMAEDLVDNAMIVGDLDPQPCVTEQLRIHGYHRYADKFGDLEPYGSDAPAIKDSLRRHPEYRDKIHPRLNAVAGQVVWAVRVEMARTVDDVLARRTRSLLFDARAAIEAAPNVARLMAVELGQDEAWVAGQVRGFEQIAKRYLADEAVPAREPVTADGAPSEG